MKKKGRKKKKQYASSIMLSKNVMISYLLLCFLTVLGLFHIIPIYLHMIFDVLLIIYIGSVNSIPSTLQNDKDAKDKKVNDNIEKMQTEDVYMFPIMGSITLFSLYCIFKIFPKVYVNYVLKIWFFIIGMTMLSQQLSSIIETIGYQYRPNYSKRLFHFNL